MPRKNKARSQLLREATLSTADRPRWHVPVGLVLVLLTVFLVYLPALNGGLLLDDDSHITKPELQSIGGLYRIWFEVGATYQYYPLLHSAFWFEHKLWSDSVLGYHAVTLLWHMTVGRVVVLDTDAAQNSRRAVGSGDLCFAPGDGRVGGLDERAEEHALGRVLPQRDAGLSQVRRVAPAVLLFHCTVPVCSGTVDEDRNNRDVAGHALSDFLVAARRLVVEAGCADRWCRFLCWARWAASCTAWVERKLIGAEGVDFELTLLERGLVAGRVIWFYLSKLVWPANLVFFYPRWDINPKEWWQWLFPIATLGTFAGLWAMRRRWRGPLAAWLLFVGTLVPVLGFLNVYPFIFSFVADHFQYLASLGIIVPVSAGIATGLERASLPMRRAGVALCILLVGDVGRTYLEAESHVCRCRYALSSDNRAQPQLLGGAQ